MWTYYFGIINAKIFENEDERVNNTRKNFLC